MDSYKICFLLLQQKNEGCSYNTFSEGILRLLGHLAVSIDNLFPLWTISLASLRLAAEKGCRAGQGWSPVPRLRPEVAVHLESNFLMEFHQQSSAPSYHDCHLGN